MIRCLGKIGCNNASCSQKYFMSLEHLLLCRYNSLAQLISFCIECIETTRWHTTSYLVLKKLNLLQFSLLMAEIFPEKTHQTSMPVLEVEMITSAFTKHSECQVLRFKSCCQGELTLADVPAACRNLKIFTSRQTQQSRPA